MIGIGIGVSWAKQAISVVTNLLVSFKARVASYPNSIFEAEPCLAGQLTELNRDGLLSSASLVITPNAYSEGVLYDVVPNSTLGDMTVTRATTATRVNASGIIESVATNVPRLDYTGSTCPSVLIEPQRTNLLLRSEEFDNVYWAKLSTTVTANTTISPDGTQDADTMTLTDTGSRVSTALTLGAGTYTLSFYVKKLSTTSGVTMRLLAVADGLSVSVDFTPTTQWARYSYTFTAATSVTAAQIRAQSLVGSVAIWGAQLEAGANATSYIPTTTASVTRNTDAITKTGITDLIGQTEGTLYAEVNISKIETKGILEINVDGGNFYRIRTSPTGAWLFRYRTGTGTEATFMSIANTETGIFKIAFAYKNGDYAAAVNGQLVTSSLTGIAPIGTLSSINLGLSPSSLNDSIKSAALWKTRLTNAELANLTTL